MKHITSILSLHFFRPFSSHRYYHSISSIFRSHTINNSLFLHRAGAYPPEYNRLWKFIPPPHDDVEIHRKYKMDSSNYVFTPNPMIEMDEEDVRRLGLHYYAGYFWFLAVLGFTILKAKYFHSVAITPPFYEDLSPGIYDHLNKGDSDENEFWGMEGMTDIYKPPENLRYHKFFDYEAWDYSNFLA